MHIDFIELLRFVLLSVITTPPNFLWQHFLERTFPARPRAQPVLPTDADTPPKAAGLFPGAANAAAAPVAPLSVKNTLTKWFIDCITVGAILNTFAFLVLMGLMKGRSVTQISAAIKNVSQLSFIPAYWAS